MTFQRFGIIALISYSEKLWAQNLCTDGVTGAIRIDFISGENMKIGLIKINRKTPQEDPSFNMPPSGIAYIAAVLEREGYEVKILDVTFSSKEEIDNFLEIDFDIIGFSVNSYELRPTINFLEKVKRYDKDAIIVFGGPHINIVEEDILSYKDIDYAIYGEGEYSMLDFVRSIKKTKRPTKEELSQIQGLIFRSDDEVIKNSPRGFITDLDVLPFPAFHLLDLKRYRYYPLLTSRGCPFDCCFCYNVALGKNWRARSPENIVKEMEFILANFGRKEVFIADDNFTLDMNRVEKICGLMLKRNLKMEWSVGPMRADRINPHMLKLMKEAGCSNISIGIESANPKILENIGKGEKVEDIEKAIQTIKKVDMPCVVQFMIGNPEDTLDTAMETISFVEKFRLWELARFYLALPYPKTRLWDYVERKGRWLDKNFEDYCHFSTRPIFETPEFTARERIKVLHYAQRAQKRFILKGKIRHYLQLLKTCLKDRKEIVRLFKLKSQKWLILNHN